jgi:hypothetical protein
MTPFMQKMIGVVAVLAIVMAAASLGLVLTTPQGQQPGILGAGVGATDWDSASIAKPGVRNWIDLAGNLTRKAFLIEDLIRNLTKTLDSADRNASFAIDASTRNISLSIDASAANVSALRGNGTSVLEAPTPYFNLTAAWAQVVSTGTKALNITTPSAGYYLIEADVREDWLVANVPTAGTYSLFALCDANGTAVVVNSERLGTRFDQIDNTTGATRHYTWIYGNSTGAAEVGVCGQLSALVAGRWAVASDAAGRSVISYVRLP